MTQIWRDLLFAHWPIPAATLAPHLPAPLTPDCHSGSAWLAIVPFRMTGIRPLGLPAVPGLSETLELNVRTYTTVNGVPGVYFFSLDAQSRLAVRIARRFFHLPYFDAAMSCTATDGVFHYTSRRCFANGPGHALDLTYRPIGPVYSSVPGSLEFFLTERYCLYTHSGAGTLLRGRIHHAPWPLQSAEAHFIRNTMTALPLLGDPLLHFARELPVKILDLSPC